MVENSETGNTMSLTLFAKPIRGIGTIANWYIELS